jgi:H+/Cl- antiporter ClcA/predicted transcriptional regulator
VTITLSVGSGLILGFEAPMNHMGSLVFYVLYKVYYGVNAIGRDLTEIATMGSAFGSCAAFLTPLCGFFTVRDELSLHWNSQLAIKALVGCFIAAQVGRFLRCLLFCEADFNNETCIGIGGVMRYPHSSPDDAFTFFRGKEILATIIIGILAAVFGAGISLVTKYRGMLVKEWKTSVWMKALFTSAMTALICGMYLLIASYAECKPIPTDFTNVFKNMRGLQKAGCPDGQYNPALMILSEVRNSSIQSLFAANLGDSEVSQGTLILSVLAIFMTMCIVLGLQLSSGFIYPFLLLGCCVGRMVGLWIGVHPGVCAVVGMGAFLCGFRRAVAPMCALVVELTGSTTNLVPIVVSGLIAKWIADPVIMRQFDVVIWLKGYPVMPGLSYALERILSPIKVKHAMRSPVDVLHNIETIGSIKNVLNINPHSMFPVLMPDDHVAGLVTREELVRITRLSQYDNARVNLAKAKLEAPVFFNLDSPFSAAYGVFRQLGLRNMLVLDKRGQLTGALTRSSFIRVMTDPESFARHVIENASINN